MWQRFYVVVLLLTCGTLQCASVSVSAPASHTPVVHHKLNVRCTTSTDCNLLGDCVDGSCICDKGWTGEACGQLNIRPNGNIDPKGGSKGSYIAPNHFSSWGMSVVQDSSTSMYHGFVSEFMYGCKLGSWGTNSYVNHVVADSPLGPWKQSDVSLPVWTHNPKVVKDKKSGLWVMFHIGQASNDTSNVKKCDSDKQHSSPSPASSSSSSTSSSSTTSAFPFQIHTAKQLSGPWTPVQDTHSKSAKTKTNEESLKTSNDFTTFTSFPGVSNVDAPETPQNGSIMLHSISGSGKFLLNLSSFVQNEHRSLAFAWDSCSGGASFDNGEPLHSNTGSNIGAFEILQGAGAVAVLAGDTCDLKYAYPPSENHIDGPYTQKDGLVQKTSVEYFEIVTPTQSSVTLVGSTQDAAGCRGVCETKADCTSYTWDARNTANAQSGGCWLRNDSIWAPNVTDGNPNLLVSGRPWHNDGDNPTPIIDDNTGEVTVLYRCDSVGGLGSYRVASLIGVSKAPDFRGPYETVSASPYGGAISNQDYPFDENEDPFQWKSKRGHHALFHANTWTDSRGANHPVSKYAGRLAYSTDGLDWHYSHTPAYNGSIVFANGSVIELSRMERPVLLFDSNNDIEYLINGVQVYANDDYTFTLIQTIAA
eukprot:m.136519 g.136519  ORF g.136519 m.136519 type:complete len:646 (+) comp29860_c0_seq1:110-2047(+)